MDDGDIIVWKEMKSMDGPNQKKEGSVVCNREKQMEDFREPIDTCHLRDTRFSRGIFTWQRGNSFSNYVRERLDRFLASDGWCDLVPNSVVHHFLIYRSDYNPILLRTDSNGLRRGQDKCSILRPFGVRAWKADGSSSVIVKLATCAEILSS
ncbi:R3H and coiled-coil domain-containing protein 1 [Bienertia sinuspersici]